MFESSLALPSTALGSEPPDCCALPFKHHCVRSGRWLTLLMNRISPVLFSAVLAAWVARPCWTGLSSLSTATRRGSHNRCRTRQATALPARRGSSMVEMFEKAAQDAISTPARLSKADGDGSRLKPSAENHVCRLTSLNLVLT